MRQRIDETEDFIRKIFGKAPKNTMKHQKGLDEIDRAAAQEGNAVRYLSILKPANKFDTVIM